MPGKTATTSLIAGFPVPQNPADQQFIRFNFATLQWEFVAAPGGETNLGANVGAGTGLVFRDKTGVTLNFKSLLQGTNMTITNNANDITIATLAEINLAANVGAGVGLVFRDKTGVTLNLKSILAGANITVTNNANDITIAATGAASNTFARVVKKIDETVNNSSAFQDDDELVIALNANKVYFGALFLYMNSNATADFKWLVTLPAGATAEYSTGSWDALSLMSLVDMTASTVLAGLAANFMIAIPFRIIVAGTAGNIQLRWAQDVANVSDTKVLQGSCMVLYEELP